jgi:hypothetical protein
LTYNWLRSFKELPLGDLWPSQINQAIVYLATLLDDNDISYTGGKTSLVWAFKPCQHLSLARLVQRHNIEEAITMGLLDDVNGNLDLGRR